MLRTGQINNQMTEAIFKTYKLLPETKPEAEHITGDICFLFFHITNHYEFPLKQLLTSKFENSSGTTGHQLQHY